MGMTTISSRDFNQGASRAKKAARNGPVYITERGKPTHVLMTIEDFHRRQGKKPRSLLAALAPTGEAGNFDFEPAKPPRITTPMALDSFFCSTRIPFPRCAHLTRHPPHP